MAMGSSIREKSEAKNALLDTSFLYSLVTKSDKNYQKAGSIFIDIEKCKSIFIPFIVLAELSTGLGYKNALQYCKEISNKIEISTFEDLEVFDELSSRARRSLKSNDTLILAMSKRLNAKLVTFDKRLMKYHLKL